MTTRAAEWSAPAAEDQADPWWLVMLCGLVRQAAQATEADRGRAALLAAVSHDLRAPLAAAKAAVGGLRLRDVLLTAQDREELLATAGPARYGPHDGVIRTFLRSTAVRPSTRPSLTPPCAVCPRSRG